MIKSATCFEIKMWRPIIIVLGSYHFKYESSREGDIPLLCFSPSAKNAA